MTTLYKGGETCNADPAQISAMEAGGWSTDAPKKAAPKKAKAKKQSPEPEPVEEPVVEEPVVDVITPKIPTKEDAVVI